jgi:hypothetical protein
MKLESFIKIEKRYASEAMSLLESYLNKNPKVGDIRVLMNDDQACDKFRRWSIVKKNVREIGASASQDKRSSYMPKTSFRKSKCSIFSSTDNDINELLQKVSS